MAFPPILTPLANQAGKVPLSTPALTTVMPWRIRRKVGTAPLSRDHVRASETSLVSLLVFRMIDAPASNRPDEAVDFHVQHEHPHHRPPAAAATDTPYTAYEAPHRQIVHKVDQPDHRPDGRRSVARWPSWRKSIIVRRREPRRLIEGSLDRFGIRKSLNWFTRIQSSLCLHESVPYLVSLGHPSWFRVRRANPESQGYAHPRAYPG